MNDAEVNHLRNKIINDLDLLIDSLDDVVCIEKLKKIYDDLQEVNVWKYD